MVDSRFNEKRKISSRVGYPTKIALAEHATAEACDAEMQPDHFVEHEGMRLAGTHLILDLWQANNLDDINAVVAMFYETAKATGATLLRVNLHRFTPSGGIMGVAVLADGHISIHTWPERTYAAIDLFVCGSAKPHAAIKIVKTIFAPAILTVVEHKRGVCS